MARALGICGLELGKDALCIVHFLPKERTITSVGIQPIHDSPRTWWETIKTEIKPLIREVRSQGKQLYGEPVVCSLPAEHATVTRLMVDTGEPDVADTLRWELEQQLAGPLSDFSYDFQKLPAVRPGPVVSYIAAAYRTSWVIKTRALVKAHRLVPRVLDLDVFALINAFEQNYRDQLSAPAVLILAGDRCTKVILTWNGSIIDYEFFRFNPDTQDVSAYVQTLKGVVERLKSAYPSLTGRAPVPAYGAGMMFTWDEYAGACSQAMHELQPFNPFRNIGCELPESSVRMHGPRLAVAVGLAVREASELGG